LAIFLIFTSGAVSAGGFLPVSPEELILDYGGLLGHKLLDFGKRFETNFVL